MADTHEVASRRWLVAISALSGCDRGADEKMAPAVVWRDPVNAQRASREGN
jgi:hypothetical protein